MAILQDSWNFAKTAGESIATIRVRNLRTTLTVGKDAWGRPKKSQPLLISATVSLRKLFESASVDDEVDSSTIHYGILSKTIIEAMKAFESCGDCFTDGALSTTMRGLLDYIFTYLTHWSLDGGSEAGADFSDLEKILVDCATVKYMELQIMLPKASLLGSGVSLTGAATYDASHNSRPSVYCIGLELHNLRVPTLIGVNKNERLAKQIVAANVQIDGYNSCQDAYNELEELVVKTLEESSFETLEALAAHIGRRVIRYFLIPSFPDNHAAKVLLQSLPNNIHFHRVRISLEKPTAVMLADASVVEMLVDSDPSRNGMAKKLWEAWLEHAAVPPFPLQGRLDEYIAKNCPGDIT